LRNNKQTDGWMDGMERIFGGIFIIREYSDAVCIEEDVMRCNLI